jgi:hypothetical protein
VSSFIRQIVSLMVRTIHRGNWLRQCCGPARLAVACPSGFKDWSEPVVRVVIGFAERMVVLVAPLARRWLVVLPVWKRSPAARSSTVEPQAMTVETDEPPDLLRRARVMRSGDDGGEIVLLPFRLGCSSFVLRGDIAIVDVSRILGTTRRLF